MENVKKTNMFIFEPYSWSHCGGAIVVIADTFKEAAILAKENCTTDYDRKNGEEYDGVFSSETSGLKEDESGQWVLTKKFEVVDNKKHRVVVNNWNYG